MLFFEYYAVSGEYEVIRTLRAASFFFSFSSLFEKCPALASPTVPINCLRNGPGGASEQDEAGAAQPHP